MGGQSGSHLLARAGSCFVETLCNVAQACKNESRARHAQLAAQGITSAGRGRSVKRSASGHVPFAEPQAVPDMAAQVPVLEPVYPTQLDAHAGMLRATVYGAHPGSVPDAEACGCDIALQVRFRWILHLLTTPSMGVAGPPQLLLRRNRSCRWRQRSNHSVKSVACAPWKSPPAISSGLAQMMG